MSLYIWVEPHFSLTPWYTDFYTGLKSSLSVRRIKAEPEIIDTPYELSDPDCIVFLVGETYLWFDIMVKSLNQQQVKSCVVACELPEMHSGISISTDHSRDMLNLIRFMCESGRSRIALFGFNPSSPHDRQRMEGYKHAYFLDGLTPGDNHIYLTSGNVAECSDKLIENIRNYDAIIAGNDLYAIYLSGRLQEQGIRIPDDIYLASFGNTILSRFAKPTLSSVSVNLYQLGQTVSHVYLIWSKSKKTESFNYSVLIESMLYSRETTECRPVSDYTWKHYSFKPNETGITSYTDPDLLELVHLENFMAKADSIDLSIIHGILSNIPLDTLSEQLYLSNSALDYRISKLYRHFCVTSRQELSDFFKRYINLIDFPNPANVGNE